MKLRYTPSEDRPPVLILAATIKDAESIAAGLGIEAHVRGIRSPGRGCIASGILVDSAIWPLTEKQLAEVLPCIAGQPNAGLFRIERYVR